MKITPTGIRLFGELYAQAVRQAKYKRPVRLPKNDARRLILSQPAPAKVTPPIGREVIFFEFD